MPHLVRTHPRFTAAGLIGLASGAASVFIAPQLATTSKILIGWNAGVWTYLLMIVFLTFRAQAADVKRIAEIEDENADWCWRWCVWQPSPAWRPSCWNWPAAKTSAPATASCITPSPA